MLIYGAILLRNARPPLQKRTLDLARKDGCFKTKIQNKNISTLRVITRATIVNKNVNETLKFNRINKYYTSSSLLSSSAPKSMSKDDEKLKLSKINIHSLMNNNNDNEDSTKIHDKTINDIVENYENNNKNNRGTKPIHTRSKDKYSLLDIEKMYPNPKSRLHNIYQLIANEMKQKNPLNITYNNEKGNKKMWHCTINVKWPSELSFTASGYNKNSSANAASLRCLYYLENNGRLSPMKKPIIYSHMELKNILQRPVSLEINEQLLDEIRGIVDNYDDEIKPLITAYNNNNNNFELNTIVKNDTNFQAGAIIDPVGKSNPVSRYPDKIKERNKILKARYENCLKQNNKDILPIFNYRNEIIKEINNNQVVVIKGDTGCGKTTQVPQFIMDYFSSRGESTNCNIIVAQPRRISAISLAERIAAERKEQVGDVVGYQVRLNQELPNTPAGILFCTTGILLRKLQFNPKLEGCSHVIVDEAHERTINTDMLLSLLKRAIEINQNLKIIIMSATINAELFQNYFNCNVIQVPGRTFPVDVNFLDKIDEIGLRSPSRYDMSFNESSSLIVNDGDDNNNSIMIDIVKMGELILWINRIKPDGAILCFLPGWAEIMKMKKYLEEFQYNNNKNNNNGIIIVPVHSKMSHYDQKKIFEKPQNGIRKVVLATDIAETGITVSDVVYVVDSCVQRQVYWDEKRGISSINSQWASQANIMQRKGRAGRVKPGISYHFISKQQFNKLEKYPIPEIKRSSLEKTVLDAKTYSKKKAIEFLSSLPEAPTSSVIKKAVDDLINLGALDLNENLTPLGKRIALFTVDPKLSKAILYSSIFQCLGPIITIASVMSSDNDIFQGKLLNKEAIRKTKEIYSPTSDHTSIGWLFQQWYDYNKNGKYEARDFCMKSRLYPDKMYTLSKIRELNGQHLQHAKMIDNLYSIDNFDDKLNSYSELDELVRGILLAGTDQLLLQKDFDIRKGVLKKNTPTFTMEDGNRACLTQESVNFKRKIFPSCFLTYVRRTHSEERRMSLIRETSIISPLTAFLFTQGQFIKYYQRNNGQETNNLDEEQVLLTIQGRRNIKFICNKETADVMMKFRDAMWSIVGYIVATQGVLPVEERNNYQKIDDCKESILQILGHILSIAAEKIDSPDGCGNIKQEKDNNNDNDDDDADSFKKNW